MKICIIVCVNTKNAIGKGNDLMFKIPGDLRNFKLITDDHIVIMGRKTWDSLPIKPLPNRTNIVVTSSGVEYDAKDTNPHEFAKIIAGEPDGSIKFNSLHSALEFVNDMTFGESDEEVYIIGGGSIYKDILERDLVDKIYMTEVIDDSEGDTYFPTLKEEAWKLRFKTDPIVDSKTDLVYRFKIYERNF